MHLWPSRWAPDPNIRAHITHFALNYTFWLNLLFGAWAAWLFWLDRRHPMDHGHMHHAHDPNGHDRQHD